MINKKVFLGYSAQGVTLLANIATLPLILRSLSSENVAIWLAFTAIGSIAAFVDSSIQSNAIRYIGYITKGVRLRSLRHVSVHESSENGASDYSRRNLYVAILAIRKLYRLVIVCLATFAICIGSTYIYYITPGTEKATAVIAWLVFLSGSLIGFYSGFYTSQLNGFGLINLSNYSVLIGRLSYAALVILVFFHFPSLLTLAFASFLSQFAVIAFLATVVKKNQPPINNREKTGIKYIGYATKLIASSSSKMMVVNFSAFMITKGNFLIGSALIPLSAMASYGVTFQILSIIYLFSTTHYSVSYPSLIMLQAKGYAKQAISKFSLVIADGTLVFVFSSMILLLWGKDVLQLLGSSTSLLSPNIVILMAIVFLLELFGSLSAGYILTLNTIPFVNSSVLTALAMLLCSYFFCGPFKLGVLGLVASQALVQISYNNWKWPREVSAISGIPFLNIVFNGFSQRASNLLIAITK